MRKGLINKGWILKEFVRFYKGAYTTFDVHSPMAYEIIRSVLYPHEIKSLVKEAWQIKQKLKQEDPVITGSELGPDGIARKDSVRSFIKNASCPARRGRILFSLVSRFKPEGILELGTGLGFSSVYLAKALPGNGYIFTIEGHGGRAEIAQQLHNMMDISISHIYNGEINEALSILEAKSQTFGLVYIDGDHDGNRLLAYLSKCEPLLSSRAIIILDDIRWSRSMLDAWNTLYFGREYGLVLDFFNMGIIVRDHISSIPIRSRIVPYWMKPWRAGFFTSS